jgi:uncharacterized membrane protein
VNLLKKHKWSNEEIAAYRKEHNNLGYFNKEDRRIFVPKCYGIGRTVNWANPLTYVVLLGIIVGIIILQLFLPMFLK